MTENTPKPTPALDCLDRRAPKPPTENVHRIVRGDVIVGWLVEQWRKVPTPLGTPARQRVYRGVACWNGRAYIGSQAEEPRIAEQLLIIHRTKIAQEEGRA